MPRYHFGNVRLELNLVYPLTVVSKAIENFVSLRDIAFDFDDSGFVSLLAADIGRWREGRKGGSE